MTYTIYFELYDHKMKAQIDADAQDIAIRKLKDKIIIHKVVPDTKDPEVEYLKNLFGMK